MGSDVSNHKKITPLKEFAKNGHFLKFCAGEVVFGENFSAKPKILIIKNVFQFEPQISLVLALTPHPDFYKMLILHQCPTYEGIFVPHFSILCILGSSESKKSDI